MDDRERAHTVGAMERHRHELSTGSSHSPRPSNARRLVPLIRPRSLRGQEIHLPADQRGRKPPGALLRKKGVRPGSLVGVSIERSPELTIALLAVLKTRAAYVPDLPTPNSGWPPCSRTPIQSASCPTTVPGANYRHIGHFSALDVAADLIMGELSQPRVGRRRTINVPTFCTHRGRVEAEGGEGTHRGADESFQWDVGTLSVSVRRSVCQKTIWGFVRSFGRSGPLLAGVPSVDLPQEHFARSMRNSCSVWPTIGDAHRAGALALAAAAGARPESGRTGSHLKLWSCTENADLGVGEDAPKACRRPRLLNTYDSSEVAADVTWHESKGRQTRKPGRLGSDRQAISNTQVYVLDRSRNPFR